MKDIVNKLNIIAVVISDFTLLLLIVNLYARWFC